MKFGMQRSNRMGCNKATCPSNSTVDRQPLLRVPAQGDRLCPTNTGQSTIDLCKKKTQAVDPAWSIRLPPVYEQVAAASRMKARVPGPRTCAVHYLPAYWEVGASLPNNLEGWRLG